MKIRLRTPVSAQHKAPVGAASNVTNKLQTTSGKLPAKGGWARLPDAEDPSSWTGKDGLPICIRARPHIGRTKHKWSDHEVRRVKEIGDRLGCWSCTNKTPGTPKGNWILDHFPFYSDEEQKSEREHSGNYHPQVLIPQCQDCSNSQGGAAMAKRGSVHAKKVQLRAPGAGVRKPLGTEVLAKLTERCTEDVMRGAVPNKQALRAQGRAQDVKLQERFARLPIKAPPPPVSQDVMLPPEQQREFPMRSVSRAEIDKAFERKRAVQEALALLEKAGIQPDEKGVISILVAKPSLVRDTPMQEAPKGESYVGHHQQGSNGNGTRHPIGSTGNTPSDSPIANELFEHMQRENLPVGEARPGGNHAVPANGDVPRSMAGRISSAVLPSSVQSDETSGAHIGSENSSEQEARPQENAPGELDRDGREIGLPLADTQNPTHLHDTDYGSQGSPVNTLQAQGQGQLLVRPDSGPNIVTHAAYIERELSEVRNGLPPLGCSNCAVSGECPEYQEGGACVFNDLFRKLPIRDLDSQVAHIENLLEMDKERTLRAMLAERLTAGGQLDPRVSGQLDAHIARIRQFAQMLKAPGPRAPVGSTTISARGPGLLASLFGGAMPAGSSPSNEIPLNDGPVTPDGIVSPAQKDAPVEEVTITVSAPEEK